MEWRPFADADTPLLSGPDDMKGITMRASGGNKGRQAGVQRDEAAPMMNGQPQKIGIGDLAVPQQKAARYAFVQQGNVVLPELVAFHAHHAVQQRHGLLRRNGLRNDLRVR